MAFCASCGKIGAKTACPQCRCTKCVRSINVSFRLTLSAADCDKKCLKKDKPHKKKCAQLANEAARLEASQVELIGSDGEMTSDFASALMEIFSRFDVDGDGVLSEEHAHSHYSPSLTCR